VTHVLEVAGFTVELREGYASPAPFSGWSVFVNARP